MRNVITADCSYRTLGTADLRQRFLVEGLFAPGRSELVATDLDRAIIGSFVPLAAPLDLMGGAALRSDFFLERREAGILNLGEAGMVTADGVTYAMPRFACLYLGRGTRQVRFASDRAEAPAQFYLQSYPAHARHPNTRALLDEARHLELGSAKEANRRTIHQFIHLEGIRSCQLVLGFTELHEGSVWNTFPPHTHDRRSEIYCYFDVADGLVLHLMGQPEETRHLLVREKQVALSPSWSMHAGVGSRNYRFVWGMGGENQTFSDMDAIPMGDLA